MNILSPEAILEELTAAIVKAVPDVMQLKRGCMIREKKSGELRMVTWSYPLGGTGKLDGVEHIALGETSLSPWWHRENAVELKEDFDVVGRDITLEDVLLWAHGNCERHLEVDINGGLYASNPKNDKDVLVGRWKLGQPLHLQPEPTIAFLHSVLVKP